jgi:molybdenum cofactor cytidylyltransferase
MNGCVAVVLAAGEGRRMGIPKALLECQGGQSFLQVLSATLSQAGCRVLAVIGAQAQQVRQLSVDAELILNPDWSSGQFSSVKVGLAAALQCAPAVVVLHPVDMPLIRVDTVKAVLAGILGHQAAVATVDGVPGHPLALTRAAAEQVLSMSDVPHLEAAQARLDLVRVVSDDPGVLLNLNTPEAYQRVLGFLPRKA